MTRILITGGAGFIGAHLAAACAAAGHEVHVLLRPGSDDARLDGLGARIGRHRPDPADDAAVRRSLREAAPERVFHLAASPRRPEAADLADVRSIVRDDLDGLVRLLALACELRVPPAAFVRAGSIAEYGIAPLPHAEETREEPVTAYGAGLLAGTQLVGALQARLPFPVATARLALIYGPGQSTDYLIPLLVSRCIAGERTLVRRPDDRRDLVFVEDAVAALMTIGLGPAPRSGVLNVASGEAPTMRDVSNEIVDLTGADPGLVEFGTGEHASGAAGLCCRAEKARDLLGWAPRITLREGLERTVRRQRGEAGSRGAFPLAGRPTTVPIHEPRCEPC